MLGVEELKQKVAAGEIETVMIICPDSECRPKGKTIEANYFCDSVLAHGKNICSAIYVVDHNCNIVTACEICTWNTGFGDFQAYPDINSLKIASWMPKTAVIFTNMQMSPSDASPVWVCPRVILKSVEEKVRAAGFSGSNAASELEFFMFN